MESRLGWFLIIYFRVLPESPSWLLVVGREEDAIQQLKIVAKINGNPTQVCSLSPSTTLFVILYRRQVVEGVTECTLE